METRERFAIAAPAEAVWRLVGAFFALPEITPVYTQSRMEGQGRFRRLTDREGGELLEALLSFDEGTRRFAYRIVATKGADLRYAGCVLGIARCLKLA